MPGHLDVADDRVVVDLADALERDRPRSRQVSIVMPFIRSLSASRQRLEQRGVVVDDQDPRLVHACSSPISASPAIGSSTWNVAPAPAGSTRVISPPCSLTML